MERHIPREGTSSCPIFSSGTQGVPTLAPHWKPYRQRRPKRVCSAAYPWFDSRFSGHCLNLTVRFSYHVVPFWLHTCSTGLPGRTAIPLFTNHNVTASQSTRCHQERTQNPCHNSHYITNSLQSSRTCIVVKYWKREKVWREAVWRGE